MLQEAEKTEGFCILLFQPPETAEPSAITGWLGHESLSAVVCSLSPLCDTAEVCGPQLPGQQLTNTTNKIKTTNVKPELLRDYKQLLSLCKSD